MKINKSAFSLVEVLVSSLIIVGLFGAFFAFFGNMQSLVKQQQNKTHALFFARNTLEMLMDEDYTDEDSPDAANTPLGNGAHDTDPLPDTIAEEDCRLKTILGGKRTYTVTDSADGWYKLVDVTITWTYGGKNETFELSTIIVK